MTKQIPCRVVRSLPLANCGSRLSSAAGAYEHYNKTEERCFTGFRVTHSHEAFTYARLFRMDTVSIDPAWLGKNLDCYV
ncbi:MAG TPA: hypothetical protein VMX13_12655 [Sedimentisphaerales bacterium]|nr:hypothetical protein [Sedimentisphaerales bacterium]